MKIRLRISAIFLSLLLISSMAGILISRSVAKDMIEDEIYNHMETTSQSRANHIKAVLNEHEELVGMISTGNAFIDMVNEGKNFTIGLEAANRRINSLLQSHEKISRIRVLNRNGTVIASSHDDVGTDKSGHEIFLRGKEEINTGDLHILNSTGNITLSVSAPIHLGGEFSGVLVINFDAEKELFKILTDRTGLGRTGEVYLVNRDGYMISPSRFLNDTFLKQKIDSEQFNLFAKEHLEGDRPEDMEEKPTTYSNYRGVRVLGIHYKIMCMEWCLLAEIEEEEAFEPIDKLTNMMLAGLFVFCMVSIIISIFLSRMITRPLMKLHRGAEEIMKGNLDFKVGTDSDNEIGQLSRAFDKMASELKREQNIVMEYSKGLEEKVEKRTLELSEANIAQKREIEEKKLVEEKLKGIHKETERMNKLMFGRETRIVEMKDEVNSLLRELGRKERYGGRKDEK
ncbi:MAG: cache domain-containing protein [Candidatus Thermoplasmatota archaeon]|nr:cache domain-containing protein [Candidatus Thermoplasmatota archaeon]